MSATTNRLLLLLVLLLTSGLSWGDCHLPSATAVFGRITSFRLNTTPSQTSTTINVNCGSGLSLSLLSDDTISLALSGATWTKGNRAELRIAGSEDDAIPITGLLCYVWLPPASILPYRSIFTPYPAKT